MTSEKCLPSQESNYYWPVRLFGPVSAGEQFARKPLRFDVCICRRGVKSIYHRGKESERKRGRENEE